MLQKDSTERLYKAERFAVCGDQRGEGYQKSPLGSWGNNVVAKESWEVKAKCWLKGEELNSHLENMKCSEWGCPPGRQGETPGARRQYPGCLDT